MVTLATAPYFNLKTRKKNGTFVDTPVWFVPASQNNSYHVFANIHSGKVKRIKNFAAVQIAICDVRGRLLGEWQPGHAELVCESEEIYAAFKAKYRLVFRLFNFFSRLFGKHKERQMIRVELLAPEPKQITAVSK